jgi:SAM-dependent methyltransferase
MTDTAAHPHESIAPDRTVSPGDVMYQGNMEHYLSCGASALGVLTTAIGLARIQPPRRILDFGAGAGRVTRWLKAAFPDARIQACDLREEDMEFLRSALGVEAWTVGSDMDVTSIPGPFDVIWVGSVITHLPEAGTRRLIEKLLSICNPGGLVALSSHGRFAIEQQDRGVFRYIHDSAWQLIKSGYGDHGYGFAEYEGRSDYGVSVIGMRWLVDWVHAKRGIQLVLLSERAWDNHHDVFVIQKVGSAA